MIWDPHLNEDPVIINIDDQILSTPIYAKNIYDKIPNPPTPQYYKYRW